MATCLREPSHFTEQNQKLFENIETYKMLSKRPETEVARLSLLNDLQQLEHQHPLDQVPELQPARETRVQKMKTMEDNDSRKS